MAVNLLPSDGEASLHTDVVPDADAVMERLLASVAWRQEKARIMGREVALPRLTAWYGERGYRYSGIDNPPQPWLPDLRALRDTAERLSGRRFNAVLLNLYRSGSDSVAWHQDAERALGPDPVVASVSLGATRRFVLRHVRERGMRVALDLPHGSLLVMGPGSQRHWQHALPKTARQVGPRLNLTFRLIVVDS